MIFDTKEFWYVLIQGLKKNRVVTIGPTIPYMIGAYHFIDNSFPLDENSLNRLLTAIILSSTTEVAVLQHCGDTRQYVIGLRNKDFCKRYFSKEVPFVNPNQEKTLYITQNAIFLGNTMRDIISSLNKEYLHIIKDKTFSWDLYKEKWHKFTEKDELNILATLQK